MKKYLFMLLIPVALFAACFAEEDRASLYTLSEEVELQLPEEAEVEISKIPLRADMLCQLWDFDDLPGFALSQSQFLYHFSGLTIDDVYGIMIEGKNSCCDCVKDAQFDILEKRDDSMLFRRLIIDEEEYICFEIYRLILTDTAYHAIMCNFCYDCEDDELASAQEEMWCELLRGAKIVSR